MSIPNEILTRDRENAIKAQTLAKEKINDTKPIIIGLDIITTTAMHANKQRKSLEAIQRKPFDVMLDVRVEYENGSTKEFIWYGNERVEVNLPLETQPPLILAWTHPGLQAALTTNLNEEEDLSDSRLSMVAVTPRVRARYTKLLPDIEGIYEPWGSVGISVAATTAKKPGLKAVKLNMTREQVRAFTSQMQGIMLVTGAPGSGKTTISYQRIRFLLDQQEEASKLPIKYELESVRILLANNNLFHYSRKLLEDELDIPSNVVQLVPEFLSSYLDRVWQHKLNARPLQRKQTRLEERARDALFGLCTAADLKEYWSMYEAQITERLCDISQMSWAILTVNVATAETVAMQKALSDFTKSVSGSALPRTSQVCMDRLYRSVENPYLQLRKALGDKDKEELSKFDTDFGKWLMYVYDPLEATHAYLSAKQYPARTRIDRGIAGRGDADKLLAKALADLAGHHYAPTDYGSLAFLLRFALPQETDSKRRFRGIPTSWPDNDRIWSHLVIDEAQDLSASEAALLASLVHPLGALTISADFRQRVSATHGIEGADAVDLGCPISTSGMRKPFRFGTNKRQAPDIVKFLRAFYEQNFGEIAPFDVDLEAPQISLPELFIGDYGKVTARVRQLKNLLSRSNGSVAVLQVNENPEEKARIMSILEAVGIEPIEPTAGDGNGNRWILATVEEIKGLEFDTCLVFGLDSVDANELSYNRNRAYVALSRPANRLVMLCHEFPSILRRIPADLYHKKDARA